MKNTTRLSKINELEALKAKLDNQIKELKKMKVFELMFKNGTVFRSLNLNQFSEDEIKVLRAYKYLFEDMNKSQEEIGKYVQGYFHPNEKVSSFTIYRNFNVIALVNKYTFAQFTRAVAWSMKIEHKTMLGMFAHI